jgi:hypothetical protein
VSHRSPRSARPGHTSARDSLLSHYCTNFDDMRSATRSGSNVRVTMCWAANSVASNRRSRALRCFIGPGHAGCGYRRRFRVGCRSVRLLVRKWCRRCLAVPRNIRTKLRPAGQNRRGKRSAAWAALTKITAPLRTPPGRQRNNWRLQHENLIHPLQEPCRRRSRIGVSEAALVLHPRQTPQGLPYPRTSRPSQQPPRSERQNHSCRIAGA